MFRSSTVSTIIFKIAFLIPNQQMERQLGFVQAFLYEPRKKFKREGA